MGEVVYLFGSRPILPKPSLLRKAEEILVFFPYFLRNVWHSSFRSKYISGSLFNSREAVESYISENKRQGSNWHFACLPAFHISFDANDYILTEINTDRPFENLLNFEIFSQGITEEDFLQNISPESPCWKSSQRKTDGIILQSTQLPASSFQSFHKRTHHPSQIWTIGVCERSRSSYGGWSFPMLENRKIDLSSYGQIVQHLK